MMAVSPGRECAMRGPPVCLRKMTAEERSAVGVLARPRTAPARRVERARVVWRAGRGETPPAIAATLGLDAEAVRRRIRRFNAEGLAALDDHHRSGRPATYSPGEVAAVIAAALTAPRSLDRKSTRLNSSHANISYAVFCLKKNNNLHSVLYSSFHLLYPHFLNVHSSSSFYLSLASCPFARVMKLSPFNSDS